jgi:hypothetical protein
MIIIIIIIIIVIVFCWYVTRLPSVGPASVPKPLATSQAPIQATTSAAFRLQSLLLLLLHQTPTMVPNVVMIRVFQCTYGGCTFSKDSSSVLDVPLSVAQPAGSEQPAWVHLQRSHQSWVPLSGQQPAEQPATVFDGLMNKKTDSVPHTTSYLHPCDHL